MGSGARVNMMKVSYKCSGRRVPELLEDTFIQTARCDHIDMPRGQLLEFRHRTKGGAKCVFGQYVDLARRYSGDYLRRDKKIYFRKA